MATTNHERVGKALGLPLEGLRPFVEREFTNLYQGPALAEASHLLPDDRLLANRPLCSWDCADLLKLMWESWNTVFRATLGDAERGLVSKPEPA